MIRPRQIFGVDFSGGASAGRNIWIAQARRRSRRLELLRLDCLETLAGAADRAAALSHLIGLIRKSHDALWAIDFPFGLPVELAAMGTGWRQQLQFVCRFDGNAPRFGLWCVDQTRRLNGRLHMRRLTDREVRTPFDCYHYRIVYQTFHGMRDVLASLADAPATAVLPFQYHRLARARRVVVEACPSSTLKRLALPHQNYKQPAGGSLAAKRRRTRHTILDGLGALIDLDAPARRTIMRNPGGDALDAVIAAVGAAQAFTAADHGHIRRHARYPREGFVYA